MEHKLSQLFDLQRFQHNSRLAAVIDDVESRYALALSDNDLELVSAAGTACVPTVNTEVLLGMHSFPADTQERKP